jgi:gliding motility-associated-like protein
MAFSFCLNKLGKVVSRAILACLLSIAIIPLRAQVPCDLIQSPTFLDPWSGEVCFDDWPPGGEFEVTIPFDFCFYNQTFNSFFINNNGNITFGEVYNTFTASGFPDNFVPPMIAPFWGDVDTGDPGNCLGQVRYEVFPAYAIVYWDNVGVFPGSDPSQRNSFQVIISDGTSSILPPSCNVGFVYGDMQWTTGTASGGTNGFGGTPANVGVNRGDGVGFVQIGRFDADNFNYDGPYGNNDGVNFLDNKEFFFNICIPPGGGNNIPPFASFSGENANLTVCDPVFVCSGASRNIEFNFYPVEQNQTVTAVMNPLEPASASLVLTPTITNGTICNVVAEVDAVATPPGNYTVSFTATDNGNPAGSFIFDIQIIVTAPTLTVSISGDDQICEGDVSSLFVADSNSYQSSYWFPINSNFYSLSASDQGTYNVVAIDNNGDCGIAALSLEVNENPEPEILGENIVCVADPTSTAQIYVNQQFIDYAWFDNGFPIGGLTSDTVNVGAGDFTVEVTDNNGCTALSPVFTVNPTSFLTPNIEGNLISCFNNTNTLAADDTYFSYLWEDIGTNPPTFISNDPYIEVLEGFIQLTVGDGIGCIGSDIITITNVVPVSDAGPDQVVCSNTDAVIGSAPQPAYSYYWSPSVMVEDSLQSNTTANFVNFADEAFQQELVLRATLNGCTAYDTVLVSVNPQPLAYFEAPEPQCFENHSIDFAADGNFGPGATFVWNFGPSATPAFSSEASPQNIQFSGTGIHIVTLQIIEDGCSSFDYKLPVILRPMPVANFSADLIDGCAPMPVNFINLSESSDPIREYLWTLGDGRISASETPMNQYDQAGKYSVSLELVTEYGCRNKFEIPNLITVYPNAIANFTIEPPILTLDNPHCTITDFSSNSDEVSYSIAFWDTLFKRNLTYTFEDTGSFEIRQVVQNEFGCIDSMSLFARVQDGFNLFVPNSFSPDGDGLNDYFKVYGQDIRSFNMKIYSRWGQLLYESNDLDSGWDGKTRLSDSVLPSGSYFYMIEVVDINYNSKQLEGIFTIYR